MVALRKLVDANGWTQAEAAAALGVTQSPISDLDTRGHPTITLPAGFTARGTPVAVQRVAVRLGEATLARAGMALQRESTGTGGGPRLPDERPGRRAAGRPAVGGMVDRSAARRQASTS